MGSAEFLEALLQVIHKLRAVRRRGGEEEEEEKERKKERKKKERERERERSKRPGSRRKSHRTPSRVMQVNPDLIYVCDPVLGDNGKLYVPPALVDIFRDKIVPLVRPQRMNPCRY